MAKKTKLKKEKIVEKNIYEKALIEIFGKKAGLKASKYLLKIGKKKS